MEPIPFDKRSMERSGLMANQLTGLMLKVHVLNHGLTLC